MQTLYFDHPSDEDLECYLLEKATPTQADFMEEHYIACSQCVERLDAQLRLIEHVRAAFSTSVHPAQPGTVQGVEIHTRNVPARSSHAIPTSKRWAIATIAIAASFGLLATLSSVRYGRLENPRTTSLIVPVRTHTSMSVLSQTPKTPMAPPVSRHRLAQRIWTRPVRVNRAFDPPTKTQTVLIEATLFEAPSLKIEEQVIPPPPLELDIEAPEFRVKPSRLRRMFMEIATRLKLPKS